MLAIRLPEEIEARLSNLAKKTGRTKSFYARQAILEKLEELEDFYLAEKISAQVQAGKEKIIPLEDIMGQYGLEN